MSDINEEIVKLYFELDNYLVKTNLKYRVKRGKSAGDADIDLLVYREKPLDRAIIEVKGWHTETFVKTWFAASEFKWGNSRLFHFISREAKGAADKFFNGHRYRKILVVSELSSKNRADIIELCKSKGIDIIEFADIIKRIIEKTEVNKNYKDSEFQQAVRLMKLYEFVK